MDIHYKFSTKCASFISRNMVTQEHTFHSTNLLTIVILVTLSLCSTTYVGNYNNYNNDEIYITVEKNCRCKFQNFSENLETYKQSQTTSYTCFVNLLLLRFFSRFHNKHFIWEHWKNKWKYIFNLNSMHMDYLNQISLKTQDFPRWPGTQVWDNKAGYILPIYSLYV